MLGLYVSDHPLAGMESHLLRHSDTGIADLLATENPEDGEVVTIAGLVSGIQHRTARASGKPYGIVQLEDFGGEVTVMFLGKAYQEFAPGLVADSIISVKGRISVRDDGFNIHAISMFQPDTGASLGSGPLVITLQETRATPDVISALSDVLIRHSGGNEVHVRLLRDDRARILEIPFPVSVTADLYGELKSLLGPNCLV
jgi:DNA polymerase III subunit alpha